MRFHSFSVNHLPSPVAGSLPPLLESICSIDLTSECYIPKTSLFLHRQLISSSGHFQYMKSLKWLNDTLAIFHSTAENTSYNTLAARSSTRYQFHFCASTVKDFWHRMDWCGPASTSILTLCLIQSLSHSLLPYRRLSFIPSPSIHARGPRTPDLYLLFLGLFVFFITFHLVTSLQLLDCAPESFTSFFITDFFIKQFRRKIPKSEATNTV